MDTKLDYFWRTHRAHGISEPAYAMWISQGLFEGLDRLSPAEARLRLDFGASLLRQALVLNPFDHNILGFVDQLARTCTPPPGWGPWLAAQRTALAAEPRVNLEQAYGLVDAATQDVAALARLAGEGQPAMIRHLALGRLWRLGEKDALLALAAAFCASDAGALAGPLLAWAAWAAGDVDLARRLAARAPETFLGLNLAAEAALALGDRDAARECFLRSLALEPCQPYLVNRLDELDQPAADPSLVRRHRVSVLFYTFNKLAVTLETLASLLASDIGETRVALLNNGSTAFGAEEFAAGVARTSQGRVVELVQLPVNIGAPAARNWLWSLESSQGAEYVAFLDDDVLLPRDWLSLYLQDMVERPGTVVVGPKGVNPGRIPTIQYVYRFFQETGRHKIRFSNNAPMAMDLGQFDYRRPCLSVMGCCHLFDRTACERLGVPPFDIRFSPSQGDDLEHGIQVWLIGGEALYDDRVRVVHRQDAGRQGPLTEAGWGHVWGNHMKMELKLSESELAAADAASQEADRRAWLGALDRVEASLPAAARELFSRLGRNC